MKNDKVYNLLISLEDEIERKCFKIKERRKELIKKRLFGLACVFFFILPFLLIYFGASLLTMCLIVILFMAASTFILFPVIVKNLEVS